ncbi:MAG: hypothetical protein ACTSWG_06390 [Candidatus Helarchaeota archaeon]
MKGILVTRWDDKIGIVVEGKYPATLEISEDHMMRIFTTHAMGGGEAGFLSMMVEDINIASYYTGLPKEGSSQYYIALILDKDEADNADQFEEALIETTNNLLPEIKSPAFSEILKRNFFKIPQLLEMTEEMRYANIFKNEKRVKVLQKLGYGATTLDEVQKWLSDQFEEEILDLENVLLPFEKNKMILKLKVETGENNEELDCIFLIKDAFIMRSPAEKLYKMAKEGAIPEMGKIFKEYIKEVEDYFREYKLDDKDNIEIAKLISDPDLNYLISILRDKYVKKDELPNILNKTAEETQDMLNILRQNKIIRSYKDKMNDEYIFLLCDIQFPTFFPEYLIDSIRRRWMEKDIEQELAITHLEILKSVFRGEEEFALMEVEEEVEGEIEGKELVKVKLKAEVTSVEEVSIPAEYKKEEAPITPPQAEQITMSDEEIFRMTSEVNTLRVKAKTLLSKKEYEEALEAINKAIELSEKLVAAGNVEFKKRIKKFKEVVGTLNKLIAKKHIEKEKKIDKAALKDERTKVLEDADIAFTSSRYEDAIKLLERAIEISNLLGEDASEIKSMVENIKTHLGSI